jgi:hypothetical protein
MPSLMFLVDDPMYSLIVEVFTSKYGNANGKINIKGGGIKGNRGVDIVLRQELLEWLLPQLRPNSSMAKAVDGVLRIGREAGVFSVSVPATEQLEQRIKPAPAVKPGNTGPRKVETATLAEKPKKPKKKTEPKPAEPSLADVMMLLQTMSSRLDAVEEAATEPASAGAAPDF